MNILMLTNTYFPHVGGVAHSVQAFAEEYRRRGHRVLIVAPEFENRPADETDVIRMPAIQKFNGSDFSVRIPIPGWLTAALDDFQPHIVHAHHSFLIGDTALRIAAMRNLPLVFTHHTMYEQYTHYVPGDSSVLARFAIDLTTGYTNFCDAVVAPSESVAAILKQRGVTTPIEVVPTGVDVAKYAAGDGVAFRHEMGIPADAFVVGHVGRLAPEKNLEFLAIAVAAFLRRHPQAHFVVVGSGPSEDAISKRFAAPRIQGRLHMAGVCKGQRLADAYAAMDAFAFASHSETQGMVLTEAMAASLPVVAIDAPGVREVVVDEVNGRLLPSENVRSFAAALRWIERQSPDRRQSMQRAARQRAEEFSLANTADRALALYEKLVAGAARNKTPEDSHWEATLRLIEAEWQLWSNLAQAAGSTLDSSEIFRVPVVGTALHAWRTLRRWFSRNEWGAKLLGLPPSHAPAEHGLVLIQIDGLSREQFERALNNRRMPFLRRLLAREGYLLHTHYSGVPSTTAAVQGELFYGVERAVPAFAFGDRATGEMVTMLDPHVASQVQERLTRGRLGLLAEGSAFCNIYSGGAAEPHFCSAAIGWGDLLRYGNPFNVVLFVLVNAFSLLRALALMLLEFGLAIIDCFRGVIDGHDLAKELKFIPSRVGVTILLRELATIAAGIDAARGLPVIQMNFLGYDEQAHRRGPNSAFAHWSLKGIDDAIHRVWDAARHSHRRDYVVWIYSDHGQEATQPYDKLAGKPIGEAVSEVFQQVELLHTAAATLPGRGQQLERVRYLGNRWPAKLLPKSETIASRRDEAHPQSDAAGTGEILVAAVGPIGHIYLPIDTSREVLGKAAMLLATTAQVPLVLLPLEEDKALAWTSEGTFELPRQAAEVLGAQHPFLEEAALDLSRLCHHADAGDLMLCGWRQGREPISFARENGAHGGAGAEETRGFAILPADTALPDTHRDYVRPAELRRMALDVLGRGEATRRRRPRRAQRSTLRIVTYNVHSCVGLDGKLSTSRIARVLAQCDADVVALQELDVRRARTHGIDQAHELARQLEMEFHFHPAFAIEEEHYGDAILSRFPMRLVRAGELPGRELDEDLEPRGAIWAVIEVGGQHVQIFNTHLGLRADERALQVNELLGPQWITHPDCQGPVILCGDFNLLPGSKSYRRLASQLRDTQRALNGHRPRNTWFSHYPLTRIDYVFVGQELEVTHIELPHSELARVASDHLPMVVDLKLPERRVNVEPGAPAEKQIVVP